MEWQTLHIQLGEILGDSKKKDGSLISLCTDNGIRYTADYRNRIINSGIRWTLMTFDPMYLIGSGIPIQDNKVSSLTWYYNDPGGSSGLASSGSTLYPIPGAGYFVSYPMMRLLSVSGYNTVTLKTKNIPIISTSRRSLRFLGNSHWNEVQFAFPYARRGEADSNEGGMIFISNTDSSLNPDATNWQWYATYIIDNGELTNTDRDIGLPLFLHDYILHYAVYLNKLNSQRFQEGLVINDTNNKNIQTFKQSMEMTKQLEQTK